MKTTNFMPFPSSGAMEPTDVDVSGLGFPGQIPSMKANVEFYCTPCGVLLFIDSSIIVVQPNANCRAAELSGTSEWPVQRNTKWRLFPTTGSFNYANIWHISLRLGSLHAHRPTTLILDVSAENVSIVAPLL